MLARQGILIDRLFARLLNSDCTSKILACEMIEFSWDPNKAAHNFRKHRVSFNEAATVFGDPLSITFSDPDHSIEEMRYIVVGTSEFGKILLVAHAFRNGKAHIISARKVTRGERRYYEEDS